MTRRRTPERTARDTSRSVAPDIGPATPAALRARAEPGLIVAVYGPRAALGVSTIATSLVHAFSTLRDGDAVLAELDPRLARRRARSHGGGPGLSGARAHVAHVGANGSGVLTSSESVTLLPGADAAVALRADGVWRLAAARAPAPPAGDANGVTAALDALRERFAVSVAELEHQVNERTLAAFDAADRLVLITDGTVPAVRSTQRVLRLCQRLNYPDEKMCVVVNRFDALGALGATDVATALKREVYWKIPTGRPIDVAGLASRLLEW